MYPKSVKANEHEAHWDGILLPTLHMKSLSIQAEQSVYILQFHLHANRHRDFSTPTNRSHCKTLPSPSQAEIPLLL